MQAELTREETVAKRIHSMTTSGVDFNSDGKSHTYDLIRTAAAGIAILHGIQLDEAKRRLMECCE